MIGTLYKYVGIKADIARKKLTQSPHDSAKAIKLATQWTECTCVHVVWAHYDKLCSSQQSYM